MKNTIHLSIYDTEQISNIAKALSSEQRLKILKLLDDNVLNISEIAITNFIMLSIIILTKSSKRDTIEASKI